MLPLIQKNKSWIKLKNYANVKVPSRNLQSICGPPRFPMSPIQKIVIGGGTLLIWMLIPIWGLISLPTWSLKHQNLGKARAPPPEADEQ